MKRSLTGAMMLIIALIAVSIVAAKEPGVIAINGPGIDAAIVIEPDGSPDRVMLERMFTRTTATPAGKPDGMSEGYTLTWVFMDKDEVIHESRVRFHPVEGGHGYVFFPDEAGSEGIMGYFPAPQGIQREFESLLADHGLRMIAPSATNESLVGSTGLTVPEHIAAQAAESSEVEAERASPLLEAAPAPSQPPPLLYGLALILVLGLVGWLVVSMTRRPANPST